MRPETSTERVGITSKVMLYTKVGLDVGFDQPLPLSTPRLTQRHGKRLPCLSTCTLLCFPCFPSLVTTLPVPVIRLPT